MRRIAREVLELRRSLPLSVGTSIFVRLQQGRLDKMRVGIVGPEQTPYDAALFLFDVVLPAEYPQAPPRVLIHTTGGKRVRFNPNLYAEGKVCLSLLNTWEGARGENWNPQVSTLLQVLVSIQALILVEQPYWNEPGYQLDMARPSRQMEARNYAENIACESVRLGIIDHITSPPAGFEQVVDRHFALRKDYILAMVDKACQDFLPEHRSRMVKLRGSLLAAFAQLEERVRAARPS
jgi:baculoviral IAP repeat-containing protein 6